MKELKITLLFLDTRDLEAKESHEKVLSLLLPPKPNVIAATQHSRKSNLFKVGSR